MNAHLLTESMDSMMNAKEDTTLNFGKLSLIALTAYLLLLLLMKKYSVCMEDLAQN